MQELTGPTKPTFATLEEAADVLREALRVAEHFNRKLRGSIPSSIGKQEPSDPNLQRLACEVLSLAREVRSEIETHHSVVGTSREEASNAPAQDCSPRIGRAASGY